MTRKSSAISGIILLGLTALAIPGRALAQAQLAPPNTMNERCVEAFSKTDDEKAAREVIGEAPEEIDSMEEHYAWATERAIEVFGSEEAARAAGEKIRSEKYIRRFDLLRKGAQEGHLPSLYLLAYRSRFQHAAGIPGVMTAEESLSAYRTLYDYGFPFAAMKLAQECWSNIPELPDEWRPYLPVTTPGGVTFGRKTPEMVAWLAEVAVQREACLDLMREGAFRGDTSAWGRLANYDDSNPALPVVVVPAVERYGWWELEKLSWREQGGEKDEHNYPLMRQGKLVDNSLTEQERSEAQALAKRYVKIIWPRRIPAVDGMDVLCRLKPQFAGDPDPYGPDPSLR